MCMEILIKLNFKSNLIYHKKSDCLVVRVSIYILLLKLNINNFENKLWIINKLCDLFLSLRGIVDFR